MAQKPVLEKPSRRTTKRFLVWNMLAGWALLFAALPFAPEVAAELAWPIGFMLLSMLGAYMGVGHLDLRQFVSLAQANPRAVHPSRRRGSNRDEDSERDPGYAGVPEDQL